MPDRDLDITKFSYPSYRKLKKTLGEFDAVVECNEIAIREFLEQAKKNDAKKYIQQLSKKHKVRVDEVSFLKFSSRIRQYYVTSVLQQSEQFFKDFKKEWVKYHSDLVWNDLDKGETNFQNVLRNTSVVLSSDIIDIYEYYRIVRNYMSHTDRDTSDMAKRFGKIQENSNNFLEDLHLVNLPNELDNINYTDFLILTNIVKNIAYLISTTSKPSNDRIAEILFDISKENNCKTFNGIKKLKNDEIRFEKAIKNFISTTFGRFSSDDSKYVTSKLKSLLA
ncbi:hypothetical protein [Spirosoma lituiforme]